MDFAFTTVVLILVLTLIILLVRWAIGPVFSWWWAITPAASYLVVILGIFIWVGFTLNRMH